MENRSLQHKLEAEIDITDAKIYVNQQVRMYVTKEYVTGFELVKMIRQATDRKNAIEEALVSMSALLENHLSDEGV